MLHSVKASLIGGLLSISLLLSSAGGAAARPPLRPRADPITPCGFVDVDAALPGVFYSSVGWADYDLDGRPDFLIMGQDEHNEPVTRLYHNDGADAFSEAAVNFTALSSGTAAWGDYDGDAYPDLLTTGMPVKPPEPQPHAPLALLYHNNGDGTFTEVAAPFAGVSFSMAAWADYDRDGRLDVLLSGVSDATDVVELWHNDGSGAFSRVSAPFAALDQGDVAWGDFDLDGDPDLALSGQDSVATTMTQIWENEGDGLFTLGQALPGSSNGTLDWGDYDLDGDPDLLQTGFIDGLSAAKVWRNDGGLLVDANAALTGVAYSSAAWGDYDLDGYLDVLLTGADEHFIAVAEVFRNDGAGGFIRFSGAALMGVWYGAVAWGDSAGDGRLRILLTGQYVGDKPISRVYRSEDVCNSDVRIVKTVSPATAGPGDAVTYTISMLNLGSLVGEEIMITDSMPVEIVDAELVEVTADSPDITIEQTQGAPDFLWHVPTLAPGYGGAITVRGRLANVGPGLVVVNQAVLTANADVNLSNNSPQALLTTAQPPAPAPVQLGIHNISGKPTLYWLDQPENRGGYRITRRARPYLQITDPDAISWDVPVDSEEEPTPAPVCGGMYCFYRIQGLNGSGDASEPTNEVGEYGFTLVKPGQ